MFLALPKINEGDLILLSKTDYHHFLFYSDGRVAQTDFVIDDLESELAKIEVPEEFREERKRKSLESQRAHIDSLKRLEGDYTGYIKQLEDGAESSANFDIDEAVKLYKRKELLEKAVSEGYLKDYFRVFGRNSEGVEKDLCYPYLPHLELATLGEGPLTTFGSQTFGHNKNVLCLSLVNWLIDFCGGKYEVLMPREPKLYQADSITVQNKIIEAITVGPENIRKALEGTALETYLAAGIVPEN